MKDPAKVTVAHGYEIAAMGSDDYDAVIALWAASEGIALRDADSPEGLHRYLGRNPSMSFVARCEGRLVGAVVGGHDGRRGYLHHLAVAPAHRRHGLGRALAERVLAALSAAGIRKCHLFVEGDNEAALAFWSRLGWQRRSDLAMFSFTEPGSPNA